MTWAFTKDRPIYTQLIEQIQLQIISGAWRPGERLPSVRDLAAQAAVNPNTMQRALSELERDGLLNTHRTSGRYITEDARRIQALRDSLAFEQARDFLDKMRALGYDAAHALDLLGRAAKEGN